MELSFDSGFGCVVPRWFFVEDETRDVVARKDFFPLVAYGMNFGDELSTTCGECDIVEKWHTGPARDGGQKWRDR